MPYRNMASPPRSDITLKKSIKTSQKAGDLSADTIARGGRFRQGFRRVRRFFNARTTSKAFSSALPPCRNTDAREAAGSNAFSP